jgi:8-oxo-dGTP diphosphatase
MKEAVNQIYGNKVRVRVCGLLVDGEKLLLVNHAGIREGDWWAPPGGGLEFGETVHDALRREFREECGLEVAVGEFCFVCEHVNPPLHAVELFFRVTATGGALRRGSDPESNGKPMIREVRYYTFDDLETLPPESLHGVFSIQGQKAQITSLRGCFKV